ncbi:MAG: hypothetical protein ABJC09_13840 [Terriglobia bacterium]
MQISALPTPLQQLDSRPFSFYPPILNVPHNAWIFRRATWSEIMVVNCASGEEACIPRMFVGDVSAIDHPGVVVGLRRELRWTRGTVVPYRRAVIELPVSVSDARQPAVRADRLAPVVSIRLEHPPVKRRGRKIAVVVMLGAVACVLAADFARQSQTRHKSSPGQRPWEQLTAGDDYSSAVKKLGTPVTDHTWSAPGGRSYRTLGYPGLRFTLVLIGPDKGALLYAGAVDGQGRVVDGKVSLLRSLPRF